MLYLGSSHSHGKASELARGAEAKTYIEERKKLFLPSFLCYQERERPESTEGSS